MRVTNILHIVLAALLSIGTAVLFGAAPLAQSLQGGGATPASEPAPPDGLPGAPADALLQAFDASAVTPAQGERAAPRASSVAATGAEPGAGGGPLAALARLGQSLGLGGAPQFLDPEVAFQLEVRALDASTLEARWFIEPAYYLYRDKFAFSVTDGAGVTLGPAAMPPGEIRPDPYFGDVAVLYGEARATLPLYRVTGGADTVQLRVSYQGCADAGLCYPPTDKDVAVILPPGFTAAPAGMGALRSTVQVTTPPSSASAMVSEQDRLTGILLGGDPWLIVLAFLGGGLLLSLTPCVLPMLPILSGLIVGQGSQCSRSRAFWLAFAYVQGMAVTYTLAGVAAALTGANLPVLFQDPVLLVAFAALFVALALSMFGFYELRVPASLQARLTRLSNRQRGGRFTGATVMGVLSALIVGPCVAPPLIGALGYIGQTGDPLLGAVALYALGLGMGAPLLAVGASAGHLMPRAGAWMTTINAVFGVLLLAVAIFFLDRVLPAWLSMLLWAALLMITAIYMGALDQLQTGVSGWRRLWKGSGLVLLVYGVLLMVGASGGSTDPLQPLRGLVAGGATPGQSTSHLAFRQVKGVQGLEAALREARAAGRPVMLDYYADWCISCKEMERFTFSDAAVQAALSDVVLLQTDVTANDAQDRALLRRFGLFGPPTIQFFLPGSGERTDYRVVGFMDAGRFRDHVERALAG